MHATNVNADDETSFTWLTLWFCLADTVADLQAVFVFVLFLFSVNQPCIEIETVREVSVSVYAGRELLAEISLTGY